MYPEWIQEQLDKIAKGMVSGTDPLIAGDSLRVQIGATESHILHHLHRRLDRIEAKLDRLIGFCES